MIILTLVVDGAEEVLLLLLQCFISLVVYYLFFFFFVFSAFVELSIFNLTKYKMGKVYKKKRQDKASIKKTKKKKENNRHTRFPKNNNENTNGAPIHATFAQRDMTATKMFLFNV